MQHQTPFPSQPSIKIGALAASAFRLQAFFETSAVGFMVRERAAHDILPGLVPGTMYDVQARAIGGSTGYSDWSDPVSHMCM